MEFKVITFWCDRERRDYKLIARREYKNSLLGEVWRAKCPTCGRELIRLINRATDDPYFRLSKKVRGERRKYVDDLIQIGDPRFDELYPQHKREREQKLQEEEKARWEKEQNKPTGERRNLTL